MIPPHKTGVAIFLTKKGKIIRGKFTPANISPLGCYKGRASKGEIVGKIATPNKKQTTLVEDHHTQQRKQCGKYKKWETGGNSYMAFLFHMRQKNHITTSKSTIKPIYLKFVYIQRPRTSRTNTHKAGKPNPPRHHSGQVMGRRQTQQPQKPNKPNWILGKMLPKQSLE